jgi:hypothetical protein
MSDTVRELGRVVGLFVTVGVGLGLAGFLVVTQLEVGSGGSPGLLGGLVVLQAIAILYFIGPAVAAVAGVVVGTRNGDRRTALLAGGVGSLVGAYLLFGIALGLILAAASTGSGGGGGFDLSENALAIAGVGVPAALVGAVTALLAGERSTTASRVNW